MTTPQETKPRRRRYNAHYRVRLDAKRHAKIEELLAALQRKRAAILRYVMQRGLTHTHEGTIDPSIPDRPHLVHMLLEPHLLQPVQDAADRHRRRGGGHERSGGEGSHTQAPSAPQRV